MLGNIKFIGELGKMGMLHEGILHRCIKQLLEKKRHVAINDMGEDLECLCKIMQTVGRRLDTDKARFLMNQYFERMRVFKLNPELCSRIRFMLQDCQELRNNKWVPRKRTVDPGPKTIQAVREEGAKMYGVFYPAPGMKGPHPQVNQGIMGRAMNGVHNMPHHGPTKNMSDMFGPIPPGLSDFGSSIGTGPGVITMDGFSPGYSTNMGRNRVPQGQGFVNYGENRRQEGGSPPNFQPRQNQQQQQQQQHRNHYNKQGQGQGPPGQQKEAGKNLPPRFQKQAEDSRSLIQTSPMPGQPSPQPTVTPIPMAPNNKGEINLRPQRSTFTTILKPSTPGYLPKSAQTPPTQPISMNGPASIPKPIMQKPAQITIKQVPATDKQKKESKRPLPTKMEFREITENMLKVYLDGGNSADAVKTIKTMRAPTRYQKEFVEILMERTLDKGEEERDRVGDLIGMLQKEECLTADNFMEALSSIIEKMPTLETEVPLVKSVVARYAGHAVASGVVTLTELADPMDNGQYYPLFLIILQQIHRLKDKQWLRNDFTASKINMENMLPECDRNQERMLEILEDRGLSFLFPLLRIQADLTKQVKLDASPTAIHKWIKENVETEHCSSPGFINALINNLLKHITSETVGNECDPAPLPDKTLLEKEKEKMTKYQSLLQMYMQDNIQLQLVALYTLQVFCYDHKFPKGLLLRMFVQLYDLEIVEEDTFLRWKEEVNEEYPGKGKALFQVNQWLTWLEQAEEESDEEED
eukprot:GHVU01233822.1.p1 GENE.GHVU01233822.1~~GHVU01233822.1.p1  ORF type:complete len:753 (+),score=145.13 GHVU01233822.1:752-3010(+)